MKLSVVSAADGPLRQKFEGVGASVQLVDTSPLLKFVLESGSGHAIDLEPTYVFP